MRSGLLAGTIPNTNGSSAEPSPAWAGRAAMTSSASPQNAKTRINNGLYSFSPLDCQVGVTMTQIAGRVTSVLNGSRTAFKPNEQSLFDRLVPLRALTDIFGSAPSPNAALNGPPASECLKIGEVRRLVAKYSKEEFKRAARELLKWDRDLTIEICEAERLDDAPSLTQSKVASSRVA